MIDPATNQEVNAVAQAMWDAMRESGPSWQEIIDGDGGGDFIDNTRFLARTGIEKFLELRIQKTELASGERLEMEE